MALRIVVSNLRSKKAVEPKSKSEESVLKALGYFFTLVGVLIGLYEYSASQLLTDIRKFEQAYFDEKLIIFKNISTSMSEILVDMQLRKPEGAELTYKKYKTNYWNIQLVADPTYKDLLKELRDFDVEVESYLKREGDRKKPSNQMLDAKSYSTATHILSSIDSNMNKLLLYERERIKSRDYYSNYMPWLWF